MRIKHCNNCHKDFDVMYRVQYGTLKKWVFICEDCLLNIKPKDPSYRYGGTWKR